jgi:hypothetical protein
MAIKIDKNVPLPNKISRRIYPFDLMEIGDSFLVKLKDTEALAVQKQKIYLASWRFTQVHPDKKFTTSSYNDEVRVWRIK